MPRLGLMILYRFRVKEEADVRIEWRGIGAVALLLDGFAGYLRSERGVTELTVDV